VASDMGRRLSAMVFNRLTSHAATQPVFGDRVFPLIAPQNTQYPLLCYRRVSAQVPAALSGTVHRPVITIEIKVFDRSYVGALDAASKVRAAMNNFRGELSGCTVQRCTFVGESDGAEIPQDAQMLPDYTVTQMYEVRVEDDSA
jgi:Protein of unknown function (DUF3168)